MGFAYEIFSNFLTYLYNKRKIKSFAKKLGVNPNRKPKVGELWINYKEMLCAQCELFEQYKIGNQFYIKHKCHDVTSVPADEIIVILESNFIRKGVSRKDNDCWHVKFLYNNKVLCSTMFFSFFPGDGSYHLIVPFEQEKEYKKIAKYINGLMSF